MSAADDVMPSEWHDWHDFYMLLDWIVPNSQPSRNPHKQSTSCTLAGLEPAFSMLRVLHDFPWNIKGCHCFPAAPCNMLAT
jgi:hypothetical protein